ncbi:MAG TPA: hypothetical protein VE954_03705 [Oligoflexus sp.]|uniref:hypothetical protein n=1 Tax=Oligoflexus sp. TaxID=1971216 RepID=UPI002D571DDE|nr:hypothetical protein [Oligoflexus sp.]HYX32192.1 hypothetical protein [Oligoflexus sp.]
MTNRLLLTYIDRINFQRKFYNFDALALELMEAGIRPGMHEELAPDVLTPHIRNERLLGRFLSLAAEKAYGTIGPWLNEAVDIIAAKGPTPDAGDAENL